ncbi:N-acetyltransferase [Pseudomonas sp. LTJR-52]|uniref:GNAT family N-acetyltransferase n=1 Tax=Pseudomonas sp. LTJR-52 TaxID=2479392 RepID=UPI000EFAFBFE|nr:GNAT family N-acetyltransferase [Pseudomonas sp. LTJR-52]AYN96770.1 N-acetyltransferase [Pseudomonas sp. LTJR-52]
MTTEDLAYAHKLSSVLQWPHRLDDWHLMHSLSMGVAAEDNSGLFGTAFCCPQGDYASIGLVIIDGPHQGRGLGRALMEQALAAAGSRIPLLVATEQGAPLYASQGFVIYERIYQHQTPCAPAIVAPIPVGEQLTLLTNKDYPRLTELACMASGTDRTLIITALLDIAQAVVGIERTGEIVGFALLRPFGRGMTIGPVVAENSTQAKALIATLLTQAAGQYIRLDVTQQSGLGSWLTECGIPQVDSVAQMAKGSPPQAQGGVTQMALATQALC